ncbi:MAG TPA: S9 family peptidase [Firmicutes bacterium]|nr:S9 family peptidase [Bacillota bacterium]
MSKLQLDTFTSYQFLSALNYNECADKAAYLVHQTNVEKNNYISNLWVYNKATGKSEQITETGDVKSYIWYDDNTVLYPLAKKECKSKEEYEEDSTTFALLNIGNKKSSKLFTVPLKASLVGRINDDTIVLTATKHVLRSAMLEGKQGQERKELLHQFKEEDESCTIFDEYPFWSNGTGVINKIRNGIYLYSVKNETLTQITAPYFAANQVKICKEKQQILFTGLEFDTIRSQKSGMYLYDLDSCETSCLVEPELFRIGEMGFFKDTVVFVGTENKDYSITECPKLYQVNLQTHTRTVLCGDELSVGNSVGSDCRYGSGSVFRIHGGKMYFISNIYDASHIQCCGTDGKISTILAKDGSVDMLDVCDDEIIYVAMHDMRLEELYVLPLEGGEEKRVSSHNDAFYQEFPPVMPERVYFTNSDGIEIHGWVLKPVGYDSSKTYPAILDIHGGPKTTYGEVFYHEMQYWANHGYFVFFCNPRGSDGRGNEFSYIAGRFGTIDYQDLMEFTDEVLKKYPQIDEKHVGVTGGSYGGFMTNWIIGHTNRFCAAAPQRSISNFVSMEGTTDIGKVFVSGQMLATTQTDVAKVWAQSPLKFAHNAKTPTLFIHSDEDYRCWMVEALQMYSMLVDNGVEARLCLFKGDNHELSRSGKPKNRIRRLQEITNWMDRHCKA